MKKAEGSWSGMRKYLEKEMLAPSLYGRVRYNCTAYVGMDGCHIYELYMDDNLTKQFSWETVNSYFIKQGYKSKKNPTGIGEYWEDFWATMESVPMNERTEYTDNEFADALKTYRGQPISKSLFSDNPLIRMFAIFDRRAGKRSLEKLTADMEKQPEWLKQVFIFRMKAEGLMG